MTIYVHILCSVFTRLIFIIDVWCSFIKP